MLQVNYNLLQQSVKYCCFFWILPIVIISSRSCEILQYNLTKYQFKSVESALSSSHTTAIWNTVHISDFFPYVFCDFFATAGTTGQSWGCFIINGALLVYFHLYNVWLIYCQNIMIYVNISITLLIWCTWIWSWVTKISL